MIGRNLHICPDDKFYQSFLVNQQRFSPDTENHYLVVSNSAPSHQGSVQKNLSFLPAQKIIDHLKEYEGKYNQVIFHSLPTLFRRKFLPVVPDDMMITWIFYGFEYYHRREVIGDYLGPETKNYYNSVKNPHYFQLALNRILDLIRQEPEQYSKDLHRIDRFAHWNIDEYEMIKEQYGLNKMKYVPFSMGVSIPELILDLKNNYLLFAHSGTVSNNHLDGIDQLDPSISRSFDKIVFPFSYGANNRYRDLVARKAQQKFGNKVLFLSKFLERSSYFNVLSRVKLAWMPQLRAAGAGNIRFCLMNDIPVVLNEESVLYPYYEKQGAQVFSMQSAGNQAPELSRQHRLLNNQFITKHRGEDTLKLQYRKLLSGNQ